jgi:hypothetical protein
MINKRDYGNIHGNGLSRNEVDRKWLLFEQEQAMLQNVLLSSGGGGSPQAAPAPNPPLYDYVLYFDINVISGEDAFYLLVETTASDSVNLEINYGNGIIDLVTIDPSTEYEINYTYPSFGNYTVAIAISNPEAIFRILQQ